MNCRFELSAMISMFSFICFLIALIILVAISKQNILTMGD